MPFTIFYRFMSFAIRFDYGFCVCRTVFDYKTETNQFLVPFFLLYAVFSSYFYFFFFHSSLIYLVALFRIESYSSRFWKLELRRVIFTVSFTVKYFGIVIVCNAICVNLPMCKLYEQEKRIHCVWALFFIFHLLHVYTHIHNSHASF